MKIAFILPGNNDTPVGGYKIIYQYANELMDLGHEVTIAFMYHPYSKKILKVKKLELSLKKYFGRKGNSQNVSWFSLNNDIKIVQNLIEQDSLLHYDKVIATSPETATLLFGFSDKVGEKYYFIQNYEIWNLGEKKLKQTYLLPLKKIVIAKWLGEEVYKVTKQYPTQVPNFYDHSIFYIDKQIEKRQNVVTLLNHGEPTKRTEFGLRVLEKVKQQIPDLEVYLFGTGEKPIGLPNYVQYFQKPSQDQLRSKLYGEAKVYLMPTVLEGWSLTGMEAMASGAVVVGSDIGGLRDYITNDIEGKLVDMNNFDQYVNEVIHFLNDEESRVEYAKRALHSVEKHDINNSVQILLAALSTN